MGKGSGVTVVRRSTPSGSAVDMYVTILGKDKRLHKIGCKNGLPVTEKMGDEAVGLTEFEVEYYSHVLKHN